MGSLGCGTANGLRGLLDSSDRSRLRWLARGTARRSSTAGVVALGREDLVKRLVELARHVGGDEVCSLMKWQSLYWVNREREDKRSTWF